MSAGWYKVERSMIEHPSLQSDMRYRLWSVFLSRAAHKPIRVSWRGQVVLLEAGQLVTSIRTLVKEFGWSAKAVRRALESWGVQDMVSTRSILGTLSGGGKGTVGTVVTICNWPKYQVSQEQKGTALNTPRGTSGAQVGHRWGTQNKKERMKEKTLETPDGVSLLHASAQPQQHELIPDNFPKRLPRTQNRAYIYPAEFDRFWAVYPQRGSDTKIKAYNAWRVPASNSVGVAAMLAGAARYRRYIEATNGEPAHVQTWCNREGWTGSYRLPIHGDQRRMNSASILAEAVAAEEEENLDEHRTDDPWHEDWGCDRRASDALVARDTEDT